MADTLLPPVQIQVNGNPVDVQHHGNAAPFLGDIDQDGDQDLLVGEFFRSRLRIYFCQESFPHRKLSDFEFLKIENEITSLPSSEGTEFVPQLVDLNGDGRTDLVAGSQIGKLFVYYRDMDGSFQPPEVIQDNSGKPLNVGSNSTLYVSDWDEDGDLDLIIGTGNGMVHLVPNKSGDKSLRFGENVKLDLEFAREINNAHAVVADWNDDGLLDLIVSHYQGGVMFFERIGSKAENKIEKPVELIPDSRSQGNDDKRNPKDWGKNARICVCDWNEDGRLDILLGDRCGGFNGKPMQNKQEIEREARAIKRLPLVRKQWATFYRRYKSTIPSNATKGAIVDDRAELLLKKIQDLNREIQALQKDISEFESGRQTHGYVWLFQRDGD